jgi:hypothetical protein
MHCPVTVHLCHDDDGLGPRDHRLELVRVPAPDPPTVKLHRVPHVLSPSRYLGLVSLETSDYRDAHGD